MTAMGDFRTGPGRTRYEYESEWEMSIFSVYGGDLIAVKQNRHSEMNQVA